MAKTIDSDALKEIGLSRTALQAVLAEAWPEAKRRAGVVKTRQYVQFQRTYEYDPIAFLHDCLRWDADRNEGPSGYQEEALASLVDKNRISMRGPHGLGKSALSAWAVLWFSLTRDGDDWKIPTMASRWRQLTLFLWPEIHKWIRRLRWGKIGREPFDDRTELFNLQLRLGTGSAFAMATSEPTAIEGAHADRMLYIFDESKSIPSEMFDAAEGAFSTAGITEGTEAMAMSVSTPGEPRGRFYDIQKRRPGYEDWWVRKVSKEEAIAAKRITGEWVEQRKRQWGEGSPIYINRVEGDFAEDETLGLITVDMAEKAVDRWHEWRNNGSKGTVTHIGVDVGRGGNESVVAVIYEGLIVGELRKNNVADIMHTTGVVAGLLSQHEEAIAVVDVIGIGAGVVDRLREQFPKDRVVAFNAGERTGARDKTGELGFSDKRSASWWKTRELMEGEESEIGIPDDDFLIGELTSPRYTVTSSGKIKVETKENVKERLGRSTDSADSVIQALAGNNLGIFIHSWGRGASR